MIQEVTQTVGETIKQSIATFFPVAMTVLFGLLFRGQKMERTLGRSHTVEEQRTVYPRRFWVLLRWTDGWEAKSEIG